MNFQQCPFCKLEYNPEFNVPKLLPCGHTACLICMFSILIDGEEFCCFYCPKKLNKIDQLRVLPIDQSKLRNSSNLDHSPIRRSRNLHFFSERKVIPMKDLFAFDVAPIKSKTRQDTIWGETAYSKLNLDPILSTKRPPKSQLEQSTLAFLDYQKGSKMHDSSETRLGSSSHRFLGVFTNGKKIQPFEENESNESVISGIEYARCVIPGCQRAARYDMKDKTSRFCSESCLRKWPDFPQGDPIVGSN